MNASHEAIEYARDLAERDCILDAKRSGDYANIANGRLLLLNSRIAIYREAGVVPAFLNPSR